MFLALLRREKLPAPITEHVFAKPDRKWRFDYCWPDAKLAIEKQGGIFVRGKHSRGVGQLKDFEKLNHAILRGWRVLQFTPAQLHDLETIAMIRKALNGETPDAD